ncbi:unnamed protein product [Effrenium voratum]|nr:unnamed protein product [Effrenium voratum]
MRAATTIQSVPGSSDEPMEGAGAEATPLKARPPPGSGGGTGRWRVRAYEGPEEWFEAVPALLSSEGWVQALARPNAFAHWAVFQFRFLLDSSWKTAEWFLNRPGIKELREADQKFYTVLSMQSFKRGLPLVPSKRPATVEIDAGERVGFRHWARFEPGDYGSDNFQLAQYVQHFLASVGEELRTFHTLDGCELVPYQCVVVRQEWEKVRATFLSLYPLQRTAYRRAHGGSNAPAMHEDVEPKFLPKAKSAVPKPEVFNHEPRLIVRNTFLDIEEDDEDFDRIRSELRQQEKELEHQLELRRVLQASLNSERERSAELAKTNALNAELLRACEEKLQGQRRVSDADTQELADQVDALLLLKRQLYQRIQSLEQERTSLLSQREEAVSDRSCVACLDRLANTVLLRCRHLCCCEGCAKRVTQCPVCRQNVRDRITVFMP